MIRDNYPAFRDDSRRKRSGEVDFGVHWYEAVRLGPGAPWPGWRVSWIRNTGELYAVEQIPDSDSPRRRYVVLDVFRTEEEVEHFLRGWAEEPRRLGPLVNSAWLYATAR